MSQTPPRLIAPRSYRPGPGKAGGGAEGIRTPDLCRARARVGIRIRRRAASGPFDRFPRDSGHGETSVEDKEQPWSWGRAAPPAALCESADRTRPRARSAEQLALEGRVSYACQVRAPLPTPASTGFAQRSSSDTSRRDEAIWLSAAVPWPKVASAMRRSVCRPRSPASFGRKITLCASLSSTWPHLL